MDSFIIAMIILSTVWIMLLFVLVMPPIRLKNLKSKKSKEILAKPSYVTVTEVYDDFGNYKTPVSSPLVSIKSGYANKFKFILEEKKSILDLDYIRNNDKILFSKSNYFSTGSHYFKRIYICDKNFSDFDNLKEGDLVIFKGYNPETNSYFIGRINSFDNNSKVIIKNINNCYGADLIIDKRFILYKVESIY